LPLPEQTVSFTATLVSGTPVDVSFEWDFGDETGATGEFVQHAYAAEGTYTVILTVTNVCDSYVVTDTVTVTPPIPPTAEFTSNSPVLLGDTMLFTNTSTGSEPLFYEWDFGDGVGSSTAENPSYVYGAGGFYTVTLTVTNAFGSDSAAQLVEVATAPACAFTHAPEPAGVNEPVLFTNQSTGAGPLTYAWDFGDGVGSSTDENPVYAYTAADTYTVQLDVSSVWGSDTCTDTVSVEGLPPTASFEHTCPVLLGDTAYFTNTSTGSQPFVFAWTFGDGGIAFTENTSHTYGAVGEYTVELQVSNDYGGDSAEAVCQVIEACEPVTGVSFTYAPPLVRAGYLITFTASYLPADATTPVDITWDFDDGGTASGAEVTHAFAAAGTYTVTVTADNCAGEGHAEFQQSIEVVGPEVQYVIYLPIVMRNK
jgi:PKD repeat protein